MSLSDVTILITAGDRPGYLSYALLGIRRFLPECTVVVVNDDFRYSFEAKPDNKVIWREVDRDTFLTKKRNEGVKLIDTKYTLLAADDFQFDVRTRATVIKMVDSVEALKYAVLGGTVNDRRYEGFLSVVPGEYIQETFLDTEKENPYKICKAGKFWNVDLVPNFFLAVTNVLKAVPWDETIGPIGGEHADWFLDLKEQNYAVGWTPGLNIYEQEKDSSMEDPGYRARRNRALIGHNLFLKKRGVKRYISFTEKP